MVGERARAAGRAPTPTRSLGRRPRPRLADGHRLLRGKRFPARWRGALLCGDWSQGQILAIHLDPKRFDICGKSGNIALGAPAQRDRPGSRRRRRASLHDRRARDPRRRLSPRVRRTGRRGERGGGAAGDGAPSRREGFDWLFAKSDPLAALQSNDRFARFAAARALERKGKVGIRAALALDDDRAVADGLVAMARALLRRP